MRSKSVIILLVALLFITNLFTGCINNDPEESDLDTITVVDDTGVDVKVPIDIEKIISLAPSVTEIIFSLNQGNKIVGRDSGSNYPAACENIEVVSTYEGVDIEKIISKEPDIIFMDKTLDLSENNYNKMIEYDLRVFRVYPKNLQDVLDDIDLIGKVLGMETMADTILNGLESRIDAVETQTKSISAANKPKVLHVIYYDGATSPWVATSSTFSGDLVRMAGGEVAVKDSSGKSVQITVEDMINHNSDIILTSQDDTWPTPSRQSIIDSDIMKDLNAVKNDLVIDVNADIVDRPGPRLVDGLELISDYMISYAS